MDEQSLPHELTAIILDYTCDRVALIVCHRWRAIAFGIDSYVKMRAMCGLRRLTRLQLRHVTRSLDIRTSQFPWAALGQLCGDYGKSARCRVEVDSATIDIGTEQYHISIVDESIKVYALRMTVNRMSAVHDTSFVPLDMSAPIECKAPEIVKRVCGVLRTHYNTPVE